VALLGQIQRRGPPAITVATQYAYFHLVVGCPLSVTRNTGQLVLNTSQSE
jgi:hypothetical protein